MGLLVVVNVTLRLRVYGLCCLEGNTDKVLTEDIVENAGTEVTAFFELLRKSVFVAVRTRHRDPPTISLTTSQA